MIQARTICLSFGEQEVFDHISFTINQDQKIGLVGRNGSGKSTLLKAIAGQQQLDEGSIAISSKKTVAYMPQEVILESTQSILDETMATYTQLVRTQEELAILDKALSTNPESVDLEKYAALQQELIDLNPAHLAAQAQQILAGLGFNTTQLDKAVSTLSVGWKMRIILAKLLLKKADFYLFDEPTNHLDIVAKDWFLNFLQQAKFGFLLVSHDQHFLNTVCKEILELELGHATFYKGGYNRYEEQKAHNVALLEEAYIQQQKELKQKMATIERFRAGTRAKQAQSMLKAVEKIEKITIPPSPKNVSFSFPPIVQPGKVVLEVDNVGYAFNNRQLFQHATFAINRGDKVAVVAPNGVGKSTLFNVIVNKLPLQQGSVTFGYNVKSALFVQDQLALLDKNKTILENVLLLCSKKTESQIRTLLGSFLFSNDDVYKKVGVLSGGERNRVGMVCVLLQDANFLLLDEPTNHLDIISKEVLLQALKAYKGTILFVSHDHTFINELATHIIELTPQGTFIYIGNYDAYLYQKNLTSTTAAIPTHTKISSAPLPVPDHQERKKIKNRIRNLESSITSLESQIKTLENSFATLTYNSPEFHTASEQLRLVKQELEKALAEWEELQ